MNASDFCDFHMPALANDEARHSVLISIVSQAASWRGQSDQPVQTWTLGGPGSCAAQTPGRSIVLGDLTRIQCRTLAEAVATTDFPGVMGAGRTATWFVARAEELGVSFKDPMPQRIYVLNGTPKHPDVPGHVRPVARGDAALYAEWMTAFHREATPEDRAPTQEALRNWAGADGQLFWQVDGEPVSIALILRPSRDCAAIGAVYTPPALRNRGYAGAVTAAAVDRIHADGKRTACLYTDLRNASANRCYAKIGFQPWCESWSYARAPAKTEA